jgi:hypothetical protein
MKIDKFIDKIINYNKIIIIYLKHKISYKYTNSLY